MLLKLPNSEIDILVLAWVSLDQRVPFAPVQIPSVVQRWFLTNFIAGKRSV